MNEKMSKRRIQIKELQKYNSILIRTEINVPEIPKMNADNK